MRVTWLLSAIMQVLGLERFWNGGDGGRVLGADVAPAAVAVAVQRAARASAVGLGVDRRGAAKRMPAEFLAGGHHQIGELGVAQRRHGIFALAGAFENVPARIDFPLNIAGLSGNADLVFDQVVVGLEFVVGEGPILESAVQPGSRSRRSAA